MRQHLDAADREALAAASDAEAHNREVAVAEQAARALEASRHPRQSWPPSARHSQAHPRMSSPRAFREVLSALPPASKQGPVGATFLDAYLYDISLHVRRSFSTETRTEIHIVAKALLKTFEPYPAARMR